MRLSLLNEKTMPSLKKMLQLYDLDLLERICSFWGIDSSNLDNTAAVEALVQATQDTALVAEVVESLPTSARETWSFLAANPQKTTWAQFTRKFGEVREYGPARREREEPELHPVSAAEMLWYRGLIGRAFLNLPPEPREFVFIPDELIRFANPPKSSESALEIEFFSKNLIKREIKADSRLLDHMTDWLAARRMGRELPETAWKNWRGTEAFITGIASAYGLIDKKGELVTETLAAFFQQEQTEIQLSWIANWKDSSSINDLRDIPGLVCEGNWQNDPVRPKQFLLELIQKLSPDTWYSLSSLVNVIKTIAPDYQRPSGDYDSWFIRKTADKNFLRGFDHWDEVDGALIRYLICGPLHWLGIIDLGQTDEKNKIQAFRISSLFFYFATSQKGELTRDKEVPVKISPDLVFNIPCFASRILRYQIGRFCEILSITPEETCYEITPTSLQSAQEAGLKPSQLVLLLEKQLKTPLPKTLLLMASHWEKNGLEAKIETASLLRTRTPEALTALQQNTHTAKYILEILSPTTAVINIQGKKVIRRTLMEQGILTKVEQEV